MSEFRPFEPMAGPSSGSAQIVLLPSVTVVGAVTATASTRFPGGPGSTKVQIQISNKTSAWAHVNFGNLDLGVVTAATVATGYPVAPGAVVIVSVASSVNGASVIMDAAPASATSVIFTRGEGL